MVPLETTTSSNSGLTSDTMTGLYTDVWKTNKPAKGCAVFTLRLIDGTERLFSRVMRSGFIRVFCCFRCDT